MLLYHQRMDKPFIRTSCFDSKEKCHPKGWHFSLIQISDFLLQASPRIYCDAGAIVMTEIPELPAIFIFSKSIILKVNTKQEVTTMAYRITQRISDCRAPPGVRRTICPENLYCIGKWRIFRRNHRSYGEAWPPRNRRKGSCPPDYQWRWQRRYSCNPWGYYTLF